MVARSFPRWFAVAVAGLVPFACFAIDVARGLPGGDSGELIAVAATGGVAHPPGYPLYTLLAGLWLRLLPLGEPALRLNLFSAACSAAAAIVLAIAVRRVSRSDAAAVFAAWAWAFASPAFRESLVAEVFPLNALLATCALLALVSAPARGAVALAALGTLALSHHHTLLLLAAPAFVVSAWRAFASTPARGALALQIAGAALGGLLPLLWLPVATGHAHAVVWGDATSWRGFLAVLTRAEYGTLRLDPAAAGYAPDRSHLAVFARSLPRDFGLLPLALTAPGAAWLVRARGARGVAPALGVYALLQAWFFTRIGFPADVPWLLGVVERFYVLPLVVLAFVAGVGAAWLLTLARPPMLRRALAVALPALALLPLATGAVARWSERDNRFTDALGRGLLASLPPRSVLFVRGDMLHNALLYRTEVLHERPDVTVVDQELMSDPWYVRRVRTRWPDLLPPLGRAQRVTLADGRTLAGFAVPRTDDSVDVLGEDGARTLPRVAIVGVTDAPAAALFAASRATFQRGGLLEASEDRYSGLPGTRNLLWLDQLAGRRPVAFTAVKDDSYRLRYTLVPAGFVSLAVPRGSGLPWDRALEAALAVADSADLDVYFGDYPPTGLERTELARFPALVARTAPLLCRPDAGPVAARHPAGVERIRAFARRFEPLTPSPDPDCLAAIGYLRWVDPSLRDFARATADLDRALRERPDLADAARARTVLAALRATLRSR